MTDKKAISDLRSMLAPKIEANKGNLNWLDQDGKPLPIDHTGESAGTSAASKTHAKNDQSARQTGAGPEKLRKHAT